MLLYRFAIHILRWGLIVAGILGARKARKAIDGRKGWMERLAAADILVREQGRKGQWIHVHCASLGEFEQGAEVMAALRRDAPHRPMLLTFFSPSGIEGASALEADHVDYLPFDQAASMRRFASTVDIGDTILIKYEVWPGMVEALCEAGTRVHLVAARFDEGRHPLNGLGFLVRRSMRKLTTLQTQDATSQKVLSQWGFPSCVTGDPRVDRVNHIRNHEPPDEVTIALEAIERWAARRRVIMVGSAWTPEWERIPSILEGHSDWCAVAAPHEVDAFVEPWSRRPGTSTLTQILGTHDGDELGNVLIIDGIGILKYAYRLASFAIVGGGWGKGVHNTLEPAVYGLPILFGPAISGFREIHALIESGAAHGCADGHELTEQARRWMDDEPLLTTSGNAAKRWVDSQSGAADRIAQNVLAASYGKDKGE